MAEPSEENTNHSFSFGIRPASKLKHPIKALSDTNLNKHGMGMIEVDPLKVDIAVANAETAVLGYLLLETSYFINFRYRHPLPKKKINLYHISHHLSSASDNDTILIHHVHGSDELCFMFGDTNFTAKLREISIFIPPIPRIIYASEAVVDHQAFRELIDKLEACDLKRVIVYITETSIEIIVGFERWYHVYETNFGVRGMVPGFTHCAAFMWPHCESLRKASYATNGVLICPVKDPPKCIMFRFNLQGVGDLVYVKGATSWRDISDPQLALGQLNSAQDLLLRRG